MKKIITSIIVFFALNMFSYKSYSQIIPESRIIDWSNVGVTGGIPDYPVQHSVKDFDAVGDGVTDDRTAFQNAIDATTPGNALLVPSGTYYLSNGLSIDKGIAIRGEGIDKTILECDGNSFFTIRDANWNKEYSYTDITAGGTKGSNTITLSDISSFRIGDYVYMVQTTVYPDYKVNPQQHAKIEAINGNTLTLDKELYESFQYVSKVDLLTGVGIENMHLNALEGNQITNKILFIRCIFSWMKNCEVSGTYSHPQTNAVLINESYHCEVRGCYIHNSQEEADSGWGMGYGIISAQSTDILFINNMTDYLRHSIVHGNGSGGGVMAYNFCWTTVSWGLYDVQSDLDGHNDNSPYQWLIEGNCSNIYRNENKLSMTVLRNKSRGQTEGICFNTTTTGANIIGNQLDRPKYGTTYPYIKRTGSDSLVHGNYTVKNGIGLEWDPTISNHNIPNSLFLSEKPEWFGDFAWPPYGGDLMEAGGGYNSNRIPAEVRYWNTRFPENAPTNLDGVVVNATTLELSWTSNSSIGGQVDSIDFIVVKSTDGINYERIATTGQTTYTDEDFKSDQNYWYYVRARNHVTVDVAGGAHTWSGPGGESDTSNVLKVVDGTVSVGQSYLLDNVISVYPNPADDLLNITFEYDKESEIEFCITDIAGRIVYNGQAPIFASDSHLQIDVSGLPAGLYLLNIHNTEFNQTIRFIKE